MATARPTRPAPSVSKSAPRRPAPPRGKAAASRRAASNRSNTRLIYDLVGLGLVALALILLATLIWPSRSGENLFGSAVVNGMRLVVGDGVWGFPFVLLTCGVMLAIGRARAWDNVGGAVVLFLIYLSWWHLGHVPAAGQFAQDNLLGYGGYIGAVLSWCLRSAVGQVGAHIVLFAFTLMALLYITDIPLPALLGPIERLVLAVASSTRDRATDQARSAKEQWVVGQAERRERRLQDMAERANRVETDDREAEPRSRRGKSLPRLFTRVTPEPEMAADDPAIATGFADAPEAETLPPLAPAKRSKPGVFSRIKTTPEAAEEAAPVDDAPMTFAIDREDDPEEQSDTPLPDAASAAPQAVVAGAPGKPLVVPAIKPFALPPASLLRAPSPASQSKQNESEERRQVLIQTLEDFGIGADIENVAHGPTVTRYEIALERGIKVSKIVSLADNLAMALAAIDVRVEAPIPGKSAIGIEIPNATPQMVLLREVIERPEFMNAPSKLTFTLGKDVTGACKYADLAKMPHLLIAGSTGSGKSAGLNSLICSLLYRCTPRELKFLMIDPKKVELSLYDGIPHLAAPVITNVKQAPGIFKQALKEMENRYDKFARAGTRNLEGYNAKVSEEEKLPFWVLIVDELADLMMTSGPEIETAICRLAQLARATGIHLVIATQRPSVNVITGTIKANISSRIAFAMNSAVDSRTILDATGADKLLGRGDMLFSPIDAAKPIRIQGCFVSEQETEALVNYLKTQAAPSFDVLPSTLSMATGEDDSGETSADDELFESAVKLVVSGGSASTSMLQRRFKIGYTRAARLVDIMEQRGIVGPLDGAKPRDILISREEADAMFVQKSDEGRSLE